MLGQGEPGPRGADGDRGERGDDVRENTADKRSPRLLKSLSQILYLCVFQGPSGADGGPGERVNKINLDFNLMCLWIEPPD